jgi:hypothetical protein
MASSLGIDHGLLLELLESMKTLLSALQAGHACLGQVTWRQLEDIVAEIYDPPYDEFPPEEYRRGIKHGGSMHEQDRHPLQGKNVAFFVPVDDYACT